MRERTENLTEAGEVAAGERRGFFFHLFQPSLRNPVPS